MELLIEALIAALEQAGRRAVKAFPQGLMPHLEKPVTAVGIAEAKSVDGPYAYLGMQEDKNGALRALYGKTLETEAVLEVYCPRSLGGRACMEEAERVAALLGAPLGAVQIGSFTVGPCAYDALSDCFRCALTAKSRAYLYAAANEDETEFTDFILKGVLK